MRYVSTRSWVVVWNSVESSCGGAQPWGELQSFLSSLRDTFSHHTPWQNKQDLWWLEHGQLSEARGRKRINKWSSIRGKHPPQKLLVFWEPCTPTPITPTPVCSIQYASKLNYCLKWRNGGESSFDQSHYMKRKGVLLMQIYCMVYLFSDQRHSMCSYIMTFIFIPWVSASHYSLPSKLGPGREETY